MHTWVPDAYSEAPSPVSALVSGVLVNGGMYGILRFYAIAVPSAGRAGLDELLLAFGLLSLIVGTLFVLRQSDYKRLLAYSSVEQMGLVSHRGRVRRAARAARGDPAADRARAGKEPHVLRLRARAPAVRDP
jgi:NADH:ubiquinone oxidoreductase subunit 4 (subunit M)